ncbi:BatD family protein [[Pseudomonas] boreopolis]|uniref:BatD family protein n=1 Tax=Xanthomonas boreopolis TaxID=86183 RepID=UPI003D9BDBDD
MNPRQASSTWGWMPSVLLLALAGAAQAETRAWLDRDAVAVGEPVTLNIETDQGSVVPDYSPLRGDFSLSGESSSRQMQVVNGAMSVRALFGVVLTPRRAGDLAIPALRVGGETTAPLRLRVSGDARDAAPAAVQGNERVFVETVVDDKQPYVQQSVGVVVRLYFATQLASGELDLATPDGASLQRVGDDVSSVKTVNGRQYNVVERRFLLVPERSGPLTLPGARFDGRAIGGFFDDFFDRGSGTLSARGASQTLQVRAQPDDAPQPWLPLHDLRLRYTATPQQAIAGQAVQVVVEATAEGATRSQFPDLPTPTVADAQVFAEPAQYDERFVGGTPQLKLTRRYSIVPNRAGALVVPGLRMDWWDVAAGAAREARLPDIKLQVAPGSGGFATPPPPVPARSAPAEASTRAPGNDVEAGAAAPRPWRWIGLAGLFALLWLATLAWALVRRPAARAPAAAVANGSGATPAPRYALADLRRALDADGLDEVGRVLCAMGGVPDLDQVVAKLDSAPQREAIVRLQRARWAGEGDVAGARQALREAFRQGPQWRAAAPREQEALESLYPR